MTVTQLVVQRQEVQRLVNSKSGDGSVRAATVLYKKLCNIKYNLSHLLLIMVLHTVLWCVSSICKAV